MARILEKKIRAIELEEKISVANVANEKEKERFFGKIAESKISDRNKKETIFEKKLEQMFQRRQAKENEKRTKSKERDDKIKMV